MKKLLGGLGLLTLMAFSVFTGPSQAATATKKITVTPKYAYDVSKEVTLTGTVSDVVKKPKVGMLLGTHLTLATKSKGSVDAHIGSFVGRDKHLDSLAAGQSIKAVGMMMTLKQGQVFIVRTIETDSETITVRNKNGFFVGPPSKRFTDKASSKTTAKGGLR